MADESVENGNGERATVALVNATVKTVDVKVDGLRSLIAAEFEDLKRVVYPLATAITGLNDRLLHLEARVADIENKRDEESDDRERRHNYRSVHLPSLAFALLGLLLTLAAFYLTYLHH